MNETEKPAFEDQNDIVDTLVNFALVCRGSLADFTKIKEYVADWTESRIIYQKTSVGKLRVEEVTA